MQLDLITDLPSFVMHVNLIFIFPSFIYYSMIITIKHEKRQLNLHLTFSVGITCGVAVTVH